MQENCQDYNKVFKLTDNDISFDEAVPQMRFDLFLNWKKGRFRSDFKVLLFQYCSILAEAVKSMYTIKLTTNTCYVGPIYKT